MGTGQQEARAVSLSTHVFLLPLPIQGPVNCMLKLAELLCLSGLTVTLLNTEHNHHRLLSHTNILSRFAKYPTFRFQTVSDGLPDDLPRTADRFWEMLESFESVAKPFLKEILSTDPLTSVLVADGLLSFAFDVAQDVKVPFIYFETISTCCLWVYLCLPNLNQSGDLPITGNDLDELIVNMPGMEGILRGRDLPAFCRAGSLFDRKSLEFVLMEVQRIPRAQGLILNTFAELEGPLLSHIRSFSPNLYSIGPLHTQLKTRLVAEAEPQANYSNSLWEEDKSCITWLNSQPSNSVLYVSFGSMVAITKDQHLEVLHGLLNSGKKFLWVIRPDGIIGGEIDHQIPKDLEEGIKERGCIVGWAPQEEVLTQPAIGGFLTHSGWNSTLESMVEGVPMIGWPHNIDQQVNSRFVSEVWKVGLDMKDSCDRRIVEEMVREVMDTRADEFKQCGEKLSKLAKASVRVGGSSCCDLDRLIDDIRKLPMQT